VRITNKIERRQILMSKDKTKNWKFIKSYKDRSKAYSKKREWDKRSKVSHKVKKLKNGSHGVFFLERKW